VLLYDTVRYLVKFFFYIGIKQNFEIQGDFEMRVQILTTSYWLIFKEFCQKIMDVFLKCAEILPTRLFDNVED
jgi:hypothetical protein